MSRHPVLASAVCAAVAVLGLLGLVACDNSSSGSTRVSPRPNPDAVRSAWAVTYKGNILATTDGGAHWFKQTSGTRCALTGVSFADLSHGWAVGGGAPQTGQEQYSRLILATSDGGRHWLPQYESAGLPLLTVVCADATHVWAAGQGSGTALIMGSSDGGRTWATQYTSDTAGSIVDTVCVDAVHCWAVSDIGTVLATTDGGAHWQVQATLRGISWETGIAFADTSHGWVVGGGISAPPGSQSLARVWATSDGGATWKPAPAPQGMVAGMGPIACTDLSHVWAGAGPGGIFRSTDGGLDWIATTKSIEPGAVMAIAFSDPSHGWAVTVNGARTTIVATTDGGVSWRRQISPGRPTGNGDQVLDIACPPADRNAD